MNKKGFTLVELLAVVVILSLLALLTSTAVTKLVSDAKEDLSKTQINLIKSAAELWGADNLDKLPDSGKCNYITLSLLKNNGLIDEEILDLKTSKSISDKLKIKISTTKTSSGLSTSYEVNPTSVDGCEALASCYAIEGKGTKVADKIACKIGNTTENFYVIKNDGENIEMLPETVNQYKGMSYDGRFSSTVYWLDENYMNLPKYSSGKIYDENADILYTYIESYVKYLKDNGIDNVTGTLLTYEQLTELQDYLKAWKLGNPADNSFYWINYNGGSSDYVLCAYVNAYNAWGDEYYYYGGGFVSNNETCSARPVLIIPAYELQ